MQNVTLNNGVRTPVLGFDVFDFELSDLEMAQIAGLDTGHSIFFDHRDPAQAARLNAVHLDI